jgi:DNA replication licensing factor MCM3
MLLRNGKRLLVSLDDLRQFQRTLCTRLLDEPSLVIEGFQRSLNEHIRLIADLHGNDGDDLDKTNFTSSSSSSSSSSSAYRVGFEGSFGANRVTPRTLGAAMLSSLVCVEGIVTKCGLVRPKVAQSVHYCEATRRVIKQNYRDLTALSGGLPSKAGYRKEDKDGNPLTTEFGLSTFVDHQLVTIQEMPENAPPGQLPRSVDIVLDDDLVDRCKAGDRVRISGVYRALPAAGKGAGGGGSETAGLFRTVLLANNVAQLNKDSVGSTGSIITDVDIANIRRIASEAPSGRALLDRLAQSVAPSIYGHEHIKRALLLLLLGGEEKNLTTGTHLRGDMNMLMVGDPSTAKSQLLRFVLHIAPLAISTSGRGSSGVGLTAAVTSDSETGERRLEAGAMVLADRGVVCIDEFDKMSEEDRVAIHEVMEQQTVTIAKAGIHASLNARCSVVAAANPVYGQYNRRKQPTENIGLPDSLLSRFDLLFIVLDHLDPNLDRAISQHVLRMHQYRDPSVSVDSTLDPSASRAASVADEFVATSTDSVAATNKPTSVYQPFDLMLHGPSSASDSSSSSSSSSNDADADSPSSSHNLQKRYFSVQFLKKFILYAKHRVHPKLTPNASEYLASAYAELRSKEQVKTLPVTPRTLETLIRLASAAARCRLSNRVMREDAIVALDIMNYSLFHDDHSSAPPATAMDDDDDDQQFHEDDDEQDTRKRPRQASQDQEEEKDIDEEPRRSKRQRRRTGYEDLDEDIDDQSDAATTAAQPVLRNDRFALFRSKFVQAMRSRREAPVDHLMRSLNRLLSATIVPFADTETRAALNRLESEGKIMLSEDTIILL